MLLLGDKFPDFEAMTTDGPIKFHQFIGNSWCILFSHPDDFTPVCTTELARAAQLEPEFRKRNCKMMALSCNDMASHLSWLEDIKHYANIDRSVKFPFPIIDDQHRILAIRLGMIENNSMAKKAGMPLTCRAVFIISPQKNLMLSFMYPATTGRNFNEILRVLDSLQLTANYRVATPVDWKRGDRCMIDPKLSDEEALRLFPCGFEGVTVPSQKNYLKLTAQPNLNVKKMDSLHSKTKEGSVYIDDDEYAHINPDYQKYEF